MDQNPGRKPETPNPSSKYWPILIEAGFEFAFAIAAPLLLFIFLENILTLVGLHAAGAWVADKRDHSPGYNLSGLLIALVLGFYMVYKKIKEIAIQLKNK